MKIVPRKYSRLYMNNGSDFYILFKEYIFEEEIKKKKKKKPIMKLFKTGSFMTLAVLLSTHKQQRTVFNFSGTVCRH
jgi:surface polysaccharide O-acyltransferase-like enzyme